MVENALPQFICQIKMPPNNIYIDDLLKSLMRKRWKSSLRAARRRRCLVRQAKVSTISKRFWGEAQCRWTTDRQAACSCRARTTRFIQWAIRFATMRRRLLRIYWRRRLQHTPQLTCWIHHWISIGLWSCRRCPQPAMRCRQWRRRLCPRCRLQTPRKNCCSHRHQWERCEGHVTNDPHQNSTNRSTKTTICWK